MDIWEVEQGKMPLPCSVLVRPPLGYLVNF